AIIVSHQYKIRLRKTRMNGPERFEKNVNPFFGEDSAQITDDDAVCRNSIFLMEFGNDLFSIEPLKIDKIVHHAHFFTAVHTIGFGGRIRIADDPSNTVPCPQELIKKAAEPMPMNVSCMKNDGDVKN